MSASNNSAHNSKRPDVDRSNLAASTPETEPEFDDSPSHDDPDPEGCLDCWSLRQLYAPPARAKVTHCCAAHGEEKPPAPKPTLRSHQALAGRKGAKIRNAQRVGAKKTPAVPHRRKKPKKAKKETEE
jgi:hypothetical protein